MFRRPCNDKMKRNYFVRRKTNVSFELNTSLTSPHVSQISNREFLCFLHQKQNSFSCAEKLGKIGIQDWQFVKTCGEQQSVSLKIRNPGCGCRGNVLLGNGIWSVLSGGLWSLLFFRFGQKPACSKEIFYPYVNKNNVPMTENWAW